MACEYWVNRDLKTSEPILKYVFGACTPPFITIQLLLDHQRLISVQSETRDKDKVCLELHVFLPQPLSGAGSGPYPPHPHPQLCLETKHTS